MQTSMCFNKDLIPLCGDVEPHPGMLSRGVLNKDLIPLCGDVEPHPGMTGKHNPAEKRNARALLYKKFIKCPLGHAWHEGFKTQTTGHHGNKYRYSCGECDVLFTQIKPQVLQETGKGIADRDAKIVGNSKAYVSLTRNTIRDDTMNITDKNMYWICI